MVPSLDIKVKNGEITVNDAHVIKADVKDPLGVVHVIDEVLIPPGRVSSANLASKIPGSAASYWASRCHR